MYGIDSEAMSFSKKWGGWRSHAIIMHSADLLRTGEKNWNYIKFLVLEFSVQFFCAKIGAGISGMG